MRTYTIEDLFELNGELINPGEDHAIINKPQIESALSNQWSYYEYDEQIAAALLRAITINHGFANGNKRTALAAAYGIKPFDIDDDEAWKIVVEIASEGGSKLSVNHIANKLYNTDLEESFELNEAKRKLLDRSYETYFIADLTDNDEPDTFFNKHDVQLINYRSYLMHNYYEAKLEYYKAFRDDEEWKERHPVLWGCDQQPEAYTDIPYVEGSYTILLDHWPPEQTYCFTGEIDTDEPLESVNEDYTGDQLRSDIDDEIDEELHKILKEYTKGTALDGIISDDIMVYNEFTDQIVRRMCYLKKNSVSIREDKEQVERLLQKFKDADRILAYVIDYYINKKITENDVLLITYVHRPETYMLGEDTQKENNIDGKPLLVSYKLKESKEDIEKFYQWAGTDLANKFFKLKDRLIGNEKDIYYWINKKSETNNLLGQEMLSNKLDELENIPTRKQRDALGNNGAELIFEDDNWKVYHILSFEGAVRYGKDTKWCITGKNTGSDHDNKHDYQGGKHYWDMYNDRGDELYYYIDKNNKNHKYALTITKDGDWILFNEQDYIEVGNNIDYKHCDTWNPVDSNNNHPKFPIIDNLPDINSEYDRCTKELLSENINEHVVYQSTDRGGEYIVSDEWNNKLIGALDELHRIPHLYMSPDFNNDLLNIIIYTNKQNVENIKGKIDTITNVLNKWDMQYNITELEDNESGNLVHNLYKLEITPGFIGTYALGEDYDDDIRTITGTDGLKHNVTQRFVNDIIFMQADVDFYFEASERFAPYVKYHLYTEGIENENIIYDLSMTTGNDYPLDNINNDALKGLNIVRECLNKYKLDYGIIDKYKKISEMNHHIATIYVHIPPTTYALGE